MERLRPPYVLPIHLSKSYSAHTDILYEELHAPPGVTIVRLPDHVAPRPLMAFEVPPLSL